MAAGKLPESSVAAAANARFQRGMSLLPLVIVLAIGCVTVYFIWPTGTIDMPLGVIKVSTFLRMMGAGLGLLVAVYVGAMLSDWD